MSGEEQVAEELVTIHTFFVSWSGDDPSDFKGIEELIRNKLPAHTSLEKRPPRPPKPKYKTVLTEETLEEFLLERLAPKVYERLGREVGDLSGLTRDELWRLAVPFERGGGSGQGIDYVIQFLTSDAPMIAAAIGGVTVIAKEVVQTYFSRHKGRILRLRRGDDEIEVSGYSPEEAEQLIEEFFAKIRREKLTD